MPDVADDCIFVLGCMSGLGVEIAASIIENDAEDLIVSLADIARIKFVARISGIIAGHVEYETEYSMDDWRAIHKYGTFEYGNKKYRGIVIEHHHGYSRADGLNIESVLWGDQVLL